MTVRAQSARRAAADGPTPAARHVPPARRFVMQPPSRTTPQVDAALAATGEPLESTVRDGMEQRFGHDFSGVRVHADPRSARSALSMASAAYAVGRDIVFAPGRYAPSTPEGRRLVAHELAHVVQGAGARPSGSSLPVGVRGSMQEAEADRAASAVVRSPCGAAAPIAIAARIGSPTLQGARFNVGDVTVEVNYGNLVHIPVGSVPAAIESRYTTWTGAPASGIHTKVQSLTTAQREYVLYALDLLADNTTAAHGALNRRDAVDAVVEQARTSALSPHVRSLAFEHEVLRVSGWFEVALAARLTPPTGQTLATVQSEFNPPTTSPGPAGKLDVARFRRELRAALAGLVHAVDPANWAKTGVQPIATLQGIGDLVQAEAQTFFAPYAVTARASQVAQGFQYSQRLSSTVGVPTDQGRRLAYLRNRAEIVGRMNRGELATRLTTLFAATSTTLLASLKKHPDTSIFGDTNFRSDVPAHLAQLEGVVTAMEAQPSIRAAVDRLVGHTARTTRTPTVHVGISTEFNAADTTECQARWRSTATLGHELMHVMVHPSFPDRADTVRFGQIVREGFTEVLGTQLFDHVRAKAASTPAFKAKIEGGVTGAPCPAPAAHKIEYGEAGRAADRIRVAVGDANFRAAYFLGAVRLVGLS